MPDPLTEALDVIRRHANICSRAGEYDRLLAEADRIERAQRPGITRQQIWDTIADADPEGKGSVLNHLGTPGVTWAADAVWALLADSTRNAGTPRGERDTRPPRPAGFSSLYASTAAPEVIEEHIAERRQQRDQVDGELQWLESLRAERSQQIADGTWAPAQSLGLGTPTPEEER